MRQEGASDAAGRRGHGGVSEHCEGVRSCGREVASGARRKRCSAPVTDARTAARTPSAGSAGEAYSTR